MTALFAGPSKHTPFRNGRAVSFKLGLKYERVGHFSLSSELGLEQFGQAGPAPLEQAEGYKVAQWRNGGEPIMHTCYAILHSSLALLNFVGEGS